MRYACVCEQHYFRPIVLIVNQSNISVPPKSPKRDGDASSQHVYYETDLDTMSSRNIAVTSQKPRSQSYHSLPRSAHEPSLRRDVNQKLDLNQNSVYNNQNGGGGERWSSYRDLNNSNNNYNSDTLPRSQGGRGGPYASDMDVSRSSQSQDGVFTAKRIFVQSPATNRRNVPVTQVRVHSFNLCNILAINLEHTVAYMGRILTLSLVCCDRFIRKVVMMTHRLMLARCQSTAARQTNLSGVSTVCQRRVGWACRVGVLVVTCVLHLGLAVTPIIITAALL